MTRQIDELHEGGTWPDIPTLTPITTVPRRLTWHATADGPNCWSAGASTRAPGQTSSPERDEPDLVTGDEARVTCPACQRAILRERVRVWRMAHPDQPATVLRVVCAWCRAVLVPGTPGAPTSHGMCPECVRAMAADLPPVDAIVDHDPRD